jgi:hypothetical protein
MSTRRSGSRRRRNRGAALLLVILTLPALSLLGMGLLGNATLEGDRTIAQKKMTQSLYSAEGGLARSRWALLTTGQLGNVGQMLPAGITAASASQNGASTGPMAWSGVITLSATGTSGPYTRTVTAQINPVPPASVDLKNVITSPGEIDIKSHICPALSTVEGKVLTGDSDTDLSACLGNHPVTVASVGMLDVSGKIAAIRAAYNEVTVTSAQINSSSVANPFIMDGSAGLKVYWTNDPGFTISNGSSIKQVTVKGEVIWLVEGGWWVGKQFHIVGSGPNPRLYILAGKNTSNNKGFDARKEMQSSGNVALLIITNGSMDFRKECDLSQVSMYGSVVGAESGQYFAYNAAVHDAWIDSLVQNNLLPIIAGSAASLAAVTGSWSAN